MIGALVLSAVVLGGTPTAEVQHCDGGKVSITQGAKGRIVYEDCFVQIRISGGWKSARVEGHVVTFENPAVDRLEVSCRCLREGWTISRQLIDDRVNGGRVDLTVKCEYLAEADLSVCLEFKSEWTASIDLDCDANWDGSIKEEDDPIEAAIGGTVGYEKFDALELKLDVDDAAATNGTVLVTVKGGVAVCCVTGGVEEVIVAPKGNSMSGSKRLSIEDARKINCVKGVSPSEKFCDCEVRAVLTLPGGYTAKDTVNYTVVSVDISIAGNDEGTEEEEGAYTLFVKDFGETPYAPRGTNYFTKVEMWIKPNDFPEELQTNICINVSGNLDHLFEKKPVEASWGGTAPYSSATNVYNMAELNRQLEIGPREPPMFALHGHSKSAELRDRSLKIVEPKTTVEDSGKFTVVKLGVVPDYDRDHKIDDLDERQLAMDKKFYWWKNDDYDKGDSADIYADQGTEVHGGNEKLRMIIRERNRRRRSNRYREDRPEPEPRMQNMDDEQVNGRTDLLDFFPMWVDAHEAFQLLGDGEDTELKLVISGLGIVDTDLTKGGAGQFLYEPHSTADGKVELHNASVEQYTTKFDKNAEWAAFRKKLVDEKNSGILMTEGKGGGGVLVLYFRKRDEKTGAMVDVVAAETPISIKDVRAFYNEVSLYGENASVIRERDPELDELFEEEKDVLSLHGFRVTSEKADGWHSEFFKRLYQSQSYARFWGVTWNGAYSDGNRNPGRFYHQDAAHGFEAGRRLKKFVAGKRGGAMKGEVSVMAHSLGNMVVSSAIALEGMDVDRYFLLDAAVAAEAYDGERDDGRMINYQWKKYPKKSFCSKWFKLFEGAPDVEEAGKIAGDARKDLKWPKFFDEMKCKVYNYYSEGDEVFELKQDVGMADGIKPLHDFDVSQYSWQKQEIGKGADMTFNLLVDESEELGISEGSGGWGFHRTGWFWRHVPGAKRFATEYSPSQAETATAEALMKNPVFAHTPGKAYEWDEYDNEYTRTQKPALLCHVVPAMSEAAGRVKLEKTGVEDRPLEQMKNGWGRSGGPYDDRWLHCDLKDMAYYYNYKAWDKIVKDGDFKKEEGK